MIGVSLSRWTMSYFALALSALIASEFLMAAGFGFPSAALRAPQTLVLVHLVVIGWLSLLLCGALFQFVPVLIAKPLYSNTLPLPALIFLVAGLLTLLSGFLQLAGIIALAPSLLPFGAGLLATGFAIALYNLARTLWAARPLPLAARFVAIALVCLAVTVTFGTIFSFAFAALVSSDALLAIAAVGLPLHITAGLGGWLTFAAMGVSYRLLAMFMLAPELEGARPQAIFWLGVVALTIAILGGLILLLAGGAIWPALIVAGVLGVVGLGLYGADMVYLYRARKRRIIELNSRMAAFALASLAGSVLLGIGLIATGHFTDRIGALVFLIIFGWLTGLGLAKLYKIVAFVTWLECYGPVLGKQPTPRVQDLVVECRAYRWFLLYFIAVWVATVALLAVQPFVFHLMAGVMAISTMAIAVQLVRTRRLANVTPATRFPSGTQAPQLLVSTPGRG